ncbi:MAG: disulfide bond formation protein DsbA [Hydrogenophilales bacterium CG17_big_fil_post_rev_8_21_14_2_50_63_12]|nr:MAG: disulfide bond formation protein DsbA [Hydrogenophilales bacterium CG17_big_fil_post_rev_8_21_14_2_50_63_12]PIX98421.1 MAG: disulfide bond formation protein DsbA [Hydrogenophilales bacterium CG_4_10_14_3_um_filter_63_21]PJB04903.1 MAG: disulfide bond formation protein DsbA [Hydrogenophilales bacterium CG_4_9_14_3_um_filter_63_34]
MKLFAPLLSALLFASTPAAALEWGKDYVEVPAQPTSVKRGQVEVLEFFWYGCPHCFHLEPELNAWVKKLPRNVVFKRVPGVLNESWLPLARAYYALEAVGLQEKLHGEVFNAIHVEHLDLNPPGAFLDWAAKHGANRKKLAAAYDSFAVDSKAMRAQQMTRDFKLNGVPAFVVAGKYTTSAYLTGGNPQTFKVIDELSALERKGKK